MANACLNQMVVFGPRKVLRSFMRQYKRFRDYPFWDVVVRRRERSSFFLFETNWSPPLDAVRLMSQAFPALRFRIEYWEGGMGFQGIAIFRAGKIVRKKEGPYHGYRGG